MPKWELDDLLMALAAPPGEGEEAPWCPREGDRIGEHEVLGRLGSGGMGVVLRARRLSTGEIVAIKVVRPELAAEDVVRRRFEREAAIGRSLTHPNVLPLLDHGEQQGLPFLVSPELQGETLHARIERRGTLTPAEVVDLLAPVASALDHAHGQGVIHRDVKPSNVFLHGQPPVAMLLDFGVAKLDWTDVQRLTESGAPIGTPAYIAPELLTRGQTITGACDQYGLGVCAFRMLSGALPHEGESLYALIASKVSKPPRSLADHAPALAPALVAPVMRALEPDPAARHPSCGAFVAALASALLAPSGRV